MFSQKTIQLFHLFSYLAVNCQLLFYLLVFADALKETPLSNFLIHRQAVDRIIARRYRIIYYTCLIASLLMVIVSLFQSDFTLIVTSSIALLCLIVDLVITLRINVPLNTMIHTYVVGDDLEKWEPVRAKWIRYFRYRGVISTIGIICVLIGLVY